LNFARGAPAGLAQLSLILWLVLSSMPSARAVGTTTVPSSQNYSQPSWGLGVVLPQGAKLAGGGDLSWEAVRNLTVSVTLPMIEDPSQSVFAVMSIMTVDGTVLQVASGIYPGNSTWLVYSMYIADVTRVPQHYTWVVNSSAPRAAPGDSEVISIYLSQSEGWAFRVADPRENSSVQLSFGLSSNQPAKAGDQEFFALESYSWDSATFEQMGSMTLGPIFVDGQRVNNGLYTFAGWDIVHSPLFSVGGATPPQFVSLGLNGSTATWSYGGTWQGDIQPGFDLPIAIACVLVLAAALAAVFASIMYVTTRSGHKKRGLPE
jgi:hypothetical protein